MLSLLITGKNGSEDGISLVKQITWSGSYQQGARKLAFDFAASPYDESIRLPDLSPGNAVQFFLDDRILFSGTIVRRERQTGAMTIGVSCYDKGFYLLQNQGVYQFRSMTPDQISRRICADFGIKVGSLAASQTAVTRNFIGVPLYRIMMTAYTQAAAADGKAYQIRFSGDTLDVVEIRENEETLILEGGVNLQSASMTDSIENTVTQVVVFSSDNQVVQTVRNEELYGLYGILQRAMRQQDGKDAGNEARKLLADNGLKQTISVENLGNIACITGNTVVVREPFTGLYGLFWITADSHVWKDGQYYNKLSLSFQRMMDEQEAGSLPNKTGSITSGKGGTDSESSGSASGSLAGWRRYVESVSNGFRK